MKALAAQSRRSEEGDTENWEERSKRLRYQQLFQEAHVPQRQANRTELSGTEWLEKKAKLERRIKTGFIVALIGDRGPGKTQMAVELIRHSCGIGWRSFYTTAMEFFIAIKGTYRDGSSQSEHEVIKTLTNPGLLVIDEVQERGETAWEDRLLTHLIDVRYRNESDTLLISNLKREPFLESLGPSITSRLVETGGIIECRWQSFREKK